MKKFLALATLVLGLASCQTEPEGFDVNVGGNQETLINVSLPEATRSADSGIANVDFNTYDLRYVLEVYDMAYTPASLVYRDVKATDDTTTTFGVRLIPGRDYKFVVWADIVENGSTEDNYYVTANGLDEVALVDAKWTAMTETRDAYTGYVVIEKYNSASTIEMTLIRPFGKLRAVTTDIDALEKLQNNALPKSVSVIYSVGAFSKFDALEATASEPIAKTFTYDLNNVYGESGNQLTLFADYLFGTETGTMQFQMDVTHENGNVTSNTFNTEIPIVHNQLTTLIGSILTDANNVKIEIDDEFAAEEIILVGEHTLTADLVVDLPIVVKAGTTATLNLNGFNIINTNKTTEYGKGEGIVVYGDLTINGEGTIQGATRAVWARGNDDAKITINGGTFKGCEAGYTGGGNSVIYASSGNVIDIYGGTFEALAEDTESYADTLYPVLNVADNNGMINVYGGSFKGQNPAAPGTEPKAWNDAHPNGFVADGYRVVKSGEYFSVVPKDFVISTEELVEAFKNGDANITLANDIVLEERLEVAAGQEVNLDLNGKTITLEGTSVDPAFYTYKGSTLTITGNGTVEIDDPSVSLIFPGGDVVIENGTFIRNVPAGTPANEVGALFVGVSGGTETVTINGGYFDGGYYNAYAADIDEILAGTKTLDETADDIAKRGQSGDTNKVRVAVRENVIKTLNKSGNNFWIYGGTFVGVNPAWGDEGCMLPTTPYYLRPWSYYQGALIEGQTFNENGIVLPAGYEITKGATADGRPTYTVTYNK